MIVNLNTYSDEEFFQNFAYKNLLGDPISLEDYNLRMHVRDHATDVTAVFELSNANGRIIITDAALGKFSLTIPLLILSNLVPGSYEHSLIRTQTASLQRRAIWRGTLTHMVGPTRWTLGEA